MWNMSKEFDALSAADTWIELDVPKRGTIHSIVIKQTDGGTDGFTFALYSSASAMNNADENSSAASQSPEAAPATSQVMEPLNCAPGSPGVECFGINRPYTNTDAVGGLIDRKQKLYAKIQPYGDAGQLRPFALSIGMTVGKTA